MSIVLIFSLLIQGQIAKAQKLPVDLIIFNAVVRTMDAAKPRAEAIAVKGNKIFAVGSNKEIRSLGGADTKIIDAKGKLVLPGFNDAHVHFMGIGNQFFSIDLREAKSPREVVEKIRFYAKFLPKGRWILGGQWNHENWNPNVLPTKDLIDAASPEHPVFIYHSSAKTALANSAALKLAGLDKNTKDAEGGTIGRGENGEPNGILTDKAMLLVSRIVPQAQTRNYAAVAETASNYAASLGVTSVQDMHSDNHLEIYRELFRNGKLKTRIYDCTPLFDWKKPAAEKIERASGDEMIRGGCLKHFSEGDYEVLPELYENILAADKANLQIMMHAIGSRANDIVLTIYERAAKENGTKDRRFRIEHAHNFRQEDLKRFGNSKIIASMQPYLFFGGGFFGSAEPYRSLLDTNAILAFGSDASITEFNPLYGIYAAINRGSSNGKNDQTITVEEAVRAYTVGSAYAEFQETSKGTISVGKLADFVILSHDIFSVNPNDILKTKVLTTILDGKIVYEDG